MALRLEQQKTQARYDGGGRGVEEALEDVDAEHVGHRQLFFAGEKDRANGFAGSPEEKYGGESGESQLIDGPKIGFAEILLEELPAHRAQGVTAIDGYEREDE